MTMPSANTNRHQNNDDRSTESEDQILRRIIPLNQLAALVPKAASNLFGGVSNGVSNGANNGVSNGANNGVSNGANNDNSKNNSKNNGKNKNQTMLFDAVAFNGDTDRDTNSYSYTSVLPNFMDMNIDIPLKHMDSNISNMSPMGNVSSRVPNAFDEDDSNSNSSDDDLDRILGSLKAGLREYKQRELNYIYTLPTLLSANNSLENECNECNEEEEVAALGDCVFQRNSNDQDSRFWRETWGVQHQQKERSRRNSHGHTFTKRSSTRFTKNDNDNDNDNDNNNHTLWKKFRSLSRRSWMIAVTVLLILTLSVMIGVLVPSFLAGRKQNNVSQAVSSESTTTTTTTTNAGFAPTKSPTLLSLTSPPMLRPSVGSQESSSHRDTVTTKPPTEQPDVWSQTYTETYNSQGNSQGNSQNSQENNSVAEENPRGRLPQVRLEMGPMVGHTTHDSVTLWAYYLKPAIYLFEDNYSIEILLYDSDGWLRTVDETEPDREKNNAVMVTLTNLEPRRKYRYEMRILDQVVGSGSFQTAPAPPSNNEGVAFEYVLASCMDRSEQPLQKAWQAIPTIDSDGTKNYPDFAILAGDTIYLQDGFDVDGIWGVDFDSYWYRNYEQRTEPHFADFISNTPIYALWNNHDYGSPDATRDQLGKEESLRAWNALWPNPSTPESNAWNTNGIYYSFYWGDVHYIVTDDHWNRNVFTENRLGYEQTEWIRSELISSEGTFKIIVIGSDITERGWRTDLESIATIITENSINGVLFHAGDIHRNEYKRQEEIEFPYPVTQITSSGIGKVWRRPFAKIAVDTTVEDPLIRVRFFGATSMEDDTTWFNDPDLVCSTIVDGDREKEHSCSETIRLSDLSF